MSLRVRRWTVATRTCDDARVGPNRGTIAAVLVALGALIAPTAGTAASRHTPKADLKFTQFKPLLGNPAYAVVDTSGVVEPIDVQVTMINQGDATARASTTIVYLDDSANRHFLQRIRVPALKPHRHFRKTLVFRAPGRPSDSPRS